MPWLRSTRNPVFTARLTGAGLDMHGQPRGAEQASVFAHSERYQQRTGRQAQLVETASAWRAVEEV
jgi:hypothetical protein